MPKFDFGLSGFSITWFTSNKLSDIFVTVGTPYFLKSLIFLHSKMTIASGFFFSISINITIVCFDILNIEKYNHFKIYL